MRHPLQKAFSRWFPEMEDLPVFSGGPTVGAVQLSQRAILFQLPIHAPQVHLFWLHREVEALAEMELEEMLEVQVRTSIWKYHLK
jgi:hypothetical protein